MIYFLRVWAVILVLTVLGWLYFRVIGPAKSFWVVLLVAALGVWGGLGLVYGLSVWLAEQ